MAFRSTTAITSDNKDIWEPCLVPELMSSEESDDDDENDEGGFVVRPLVWRSDKVTNLFNKLDHKSKKNASVRSKKMTFSRKSGLPSDRQRPPDGNLPDWCFK